MAADHVAPGLRPKTEAAQMVSLSNTVQAVIYGPGHVLFVCGRDTFRLNDREAKRLQTAYLERLNPLEVAV